LTFNKKKKKKKNPKIEHSILYPQKGMNRELSHHPSSHPPLLALKRKLSTHYRLGEGAFSFLPNIPKNKTGGKKRMSWISHPTPMSTLQMRVLNVIHENQQLNQQ
jgi:hypothetical protein